MEAHQDYFQVLGLEPGFDLDSERLETGFLTRSAQLHPDRSATDEKARVRAVLLSARLNEAYAALRDPFERAEYLLKLQGGPSASDDKHVPAGFLEEMLDYRDQLEETLAAGDPEGVRALRAKLEEQLKSLSGRLSQLFQGESGADRRTELRRTLNESAYWRGLLRDLREGQRG